MEPAQKKRRLGRFAKGVKKMRKIFGPPARGSKPLTMSTLPRAIARVGSGKNAWFQFNATGSFTNPAANTPGLQVYCLSDPSNWLIEFNSASSVDVDQQPQVTAKSIRFMANTRVAVNSTDAMRLHCFIVSLKETAINTLGGNVFGAVNVVDGINYKLGNQGNILLNPDYFQVHKTWFKQMGGYCYNSSTNSANISDTHFMMKWNKLKWNHKFKNTISNWRAISEQELPGSARIYFLGFQVNTRNQAASGQPLQLNGIVEVGW